MDSLNADAEVIHQVLKDDGTYPNNNNLPILLYKDVLSLSKRYPAEIIDELFENNKWGGSWVNGIYGFHHYHSTAHEVLGCFSGTALLEFGGAVGLTLEVQVGDIVVIPAGVAHKCVRASQFRCVGAYPVGQSWDTCYGRPGERPAADRRILSLGDLPGLPV